MNHLLQQAIQHHYLGELSEAEKLYRTILQIEPNHPDANHNLGVIAVAVDKLELALLFFKLALETNPTQAQFWLSYIDALIKVEQFDLAREVLEKGCKVGLTGEKIEEFIEHLNQISITESIKLFGVFLEKGNYIEAEKIARKITTQIPVNGEGWKALGFVLQKQDRIMESLEPCELSVLLLANDPECHNNLSIALIGHNDFIRAEKHYLIALDIYRFSKKKIDSSKVYNDLGILLYRLNRLNEAEIKYKKALELNQDNVIAHYNFALLLLLEGKLKDGWTEFMWFYHPRCTHQDKSIQPNTSAPQWIGESLNGKTILIIPEQGLGDMIQFIRYAELLKKHGATVCVGVKESLSIIFKTISYIDQIIKSDEPCILDYWTFPLQLPYYFQTTIETIPCNVPYLFADETKSIWWNEWLNQKIPTTNKRVGLVWAGNPKHPNDANRSLSFSQLAIFSDLENVTFVSLQLGEKEKKQINQGLEGVTILDASSFLYDFTDSAALLKNLDVLITVDSAPAHLAGALNFPVWVMITKVPDWRWLLERSDSPWYPSMRLFRQPEIGDWTSVLNDVKTALIQLNSQ